MATPMTRPRGGRGRLPSGQNGGGPMPMPGRGRRAPGNGGTEAPAGHPRPGAGNPQGGQGGGQQGKAGVGGQALPGPGGRQLEARVQSGAITQQQAQKTMAQRQTLAKALGSNWRDKLQVGGQSFAQVNKGLKKSPGNAKLAAIRKKLLTNRKAVLTAAQAKAKGGAEGDGTEGTPSKKKHQGAGAGKE